MIFCAICEGTKMVPGCFCRVSGNKEEIIWTGKDVKCPGCDGTGVSEKAGPDVFRPDAKEYGKYLVDLCLRYNFKGLYPLDNEIQNIQDKHDFGKAIFNANLEMIKSCDVVLYLEGQVQM
jgi:hypothetical protein